MYIRVENGNEVILRVECKDGVVGVVVEKGVVEIFPNPFVKAVSEGSPKRGRGRPRKGGDITLRGMRYRRKAEGLSRVSGRPKRNPEAF
jgi:hypothetical protein